MCKLTDHVSDTERACRRVGSRHDRRRGAAAACCSPATTCASPSFRVASRAPESPDEASGPPTMRFYFSSIIEVSALEDYE
eukprot:6205725-Pleurochrysis_carterae.AAC.5